MKYLWKQVVYTIIIILELVRQSSVVITHIYRSWYNYIVNGEQKVKVKVWGGVEAIMHTIPLKKGIGRQECCRSIK